MLSVNQMKMRTRLILILAISIAALLFFSVNSAVEKWHVAGRMSKIESLVNVSVKLGALAHELQKERGMTAGYLGSQGKKFATELPEQRKASDKRHAELKEALKGFDSRQYGAALAGLQDEAARRLDGLSAKRDAVNRLGIAAGEAINYYAETISTLLALPRQAPMLSDDSDVARLAMAYSSLLQAKERVGVERAILTNVFSVDRFTPETVAKYLTNASAITVYLNEFRVSATDQQDEFYGKNVTGQYVDEVARMKKIAEEKLSGAELGVDAGRWFEMMTGKIDLLKKVEEKLAGDLLAKAEGLRSGARTQMIAFIVLAVAAVLATAAIAYLMITSILRQLGGEPAYAAEIANRVAEGDLAVEVATRPGDTSSLLYAMKSMRDNLAALVSQTRQGADAVASAAQQMSAGAEQLSSGAQEQASSLEETASSMEQMTSTVKQSADNARQANQLALSSRDAAEKGGKVVSDAVAAMGEINKSSKKIADIITVIDEIAFQTNLLALNAAVEAARAGEQGRGFAVVAAEVRNLAQRSAASAKEIKALIQDSVQKVQGGSELVNHSGKTLEEIVTSVKKAAEIVSEIAAASQEQAAGIDQVNKAITQMDQVTQSNAAQVEELSSTSQSLAAQAQQLQALVKRFKIEEGRAQARPAQTQASEAPASASRAEGLHRRARPKAAPAKKAEPVLAGSVAGNGKGESDGFEEF
jgi:methyl-accepting chemotaxis protein